MNQSIVLDKAIKFALRIVGVYKYLTNNKNEYVLSKQLLYSGSDIAKHVKTALHSKTKSAFASEMYKGLEKALNPELWLLLLKESEFLSSEQYNSLNDDCVELIKMTSSISKTSQGEV
jgi:four helix bundle protein